MISFIHSTFSSFTFRLIEAGDGPTGSPPLESPVAAEVEGDAVTSVAISDTAFLEAPTSFVPGIYPQVIWFYILQHLQFR